MKKTALLLMLLAVISKIFGFGREIALSYFYGASTISDAYLISLTIPGTIFSFIGMGIATSYIPMYVELEKEKGKKIADKFTSNIINLILIICSIIIFLVLTNTETIVKVFASGFEGHTLEIAVKFTRLSVIGIFFSGIVFILTRYLQIKNKFIVPALLGIPFNLSIVLIIIISGISSYKYLPYGIVIAMFLQFIILVPFIRKSGYHHKFSMLVKDKHVKKMALLALPAILGTSVNQINILVDRTLASQIEIGGISALNYANRLNSFVLGIFVISIATVMYPLISKMAANNNMDGFKKKLTESITGVSLLVVPITLGTIIFAEPIVQMLFGRGAFNNNSIIMTSTVLLFYSIGMVGIAFREILSRAFYSIQDTKTPMINAAIGMGLNIVLNLILSRYLGIGGLALATSISAIFTAMLMIITLRIKIGPLGIKNTSKSFIKIVLASLVMALIAKFSFEKLIDLMGQNISLIIALTISMVTYMIIIYHMKIQDVDAIVSVVKNKLRVLKK